MFRLLARTGVIIATIAVLLVAVRVVGSLTVATPAVRMFEANDCLPHPCWRGIRPGETTIEQAERILRADSALITERQTESPENLFCWRSPSDPAWEGCIPSWSQSVADNVVRSLGLWPSEPGLRLGDAIVLFGEPVSSQVCWTLNSPGNVPGPLVNVYIHFGNNITVVAYNPNRPREARFDPNMTIVRMSFLRDARPPGAPPWRGFTEPTRLGCAS